MKTNISNSARSDKKQLCLASSANNHTRSRLSSCRVTTPQLLASNLLALPSGLVICPWPPFNCINHGDHVILNLKILLWNTLSSSRTKCFQINSENKYSTNRLIWQYIVYWIVQEDAIFPLSFHVNCEKFAYWRTNLIRTRCVLLSSINYSKIILFRLNLGHQPAEPFLIHYQ